MKAIELDTVPLRNADELVAPSHVRAIAARPVMRRAAAAAPARAAGAATMSDGLRSAIRALAPQLGGAAAPGGGDIGGMFGQAVNAGIHDLGGIAQNPLGALQSAGSAALGAIGGALSGGSIGELAQNPLGALESAGTAALGAVAPGIAGAIASLRTALSEDLRRELEQLVTSPAGLAAIAAELAGSAGAAGGSDRGSTPPTGTVARHGDGVIGASAADTLADAASSSASSLPGDLRARFEAGARADLAGVRVHTDAAAASAATAFGAHAFAHGQDIYFAAGQYRPGSRDGDHLIAHEVAHTIQQRGAPPAPQYQLEVSEPGDALEVDADRMADAMVAEPSTTSHAQTHREHA